jgi:DNA modification methylase
VAAAVTPYYHDDYITLYHGDCRELMPCLDAEVMVTDPPYGYGYACGSDRSPWQHQPIANDDDLSVRDEVLAAWRGPALVFGSWKCPAPTGTHTVLVWDKGLAAGMGDLSVPWKPNFELIYVIGRGFRGRRDSGVIRDYMSWAPRGRRSHPNEKPVGLMRDLIDKCPDGLIVDPFAGTGATLRAAKDLGRRAIGIEIEERYCAIAAQRCRQEVLRLVG